MQQQRTELRAKYELAVHLRVKQWFLADAIARQEQFLSSFIPDCKGKHSTQMLHAVRTITVVSVNDRFGVTVGVKGVAELLQLFTQLKVVVNLAIKNYPRRSILIVDWLLTTFKIDDLEASHSQP